MCDTIGRVGNKENFGFFAKNSDRNPNEPQAMIYIPSKIHSSRYVKLTYIEIEQVKRTNAILISKPSWIWGAEMGINEYGVCIGNEAVKTKGEYSQIGIIGMDLVRLALERGKTAKEATEVIIAILEKYGQGGNCGYQHEKYYDNSFLIMDKNQLFILETKDKNWALKEEKSISISNCLTIGKADKYSTVKNFKHKYSQKQSIINGAKIRKILTSQGIPKKTNVEDILKIMRKHAPFSHPLTRGTGYSPCMHAGFSNDCQTTASMVVIFQEQPQIWFTGCSLPCLSIFKSCNFGDTESPFIFDETDITKYNYWLKQEKINRILQSKKLPKEFYAEKNKIENSLIAQINSNHSLKLKEVLELEENFYKKWLLCNLPSVELNHQNQNFWEETTRKLF